MGHQDKKISADNLIWVPKPIKRMFDNFHLSVAFWWFVRILVFLGFGTKRCVSMRVNRVSVGVFDNKKRVTCYQRRGHLALSKGHLIIKKVTLLSNRSSWVACQMRVKKWLKHGILPIWPTWEKSYRSPCRGPSYCQCRLLAVLMVNSEYLVCPLPDI